MTGPRRTVLALAVLMCMATLSPPAVQAKELETVLEMRDVRFHPELILVGFGDTVTIFVFNNDSSIQHTFELDDFAISSGILAGGGRWNDTFFAEANGTFYFYCAIEGHATSLGGGRWAGMAGRLQVGETPEEPTNLIPVIIVAGVVAFVAVLGAIAYAVLRRRGQKKQDDRQTGLP